MLIDKLLVKITIINFNHSSRCRKSIAFMIAIIANILSIPPASIGKNFGPRGS